MPAGARRAAAWGGLLLACLLAARPAIAVELDLQLADLPAAARSRAEAVASQAVSALPADWQADPRTLRVVFDEQLPRHVAGRHWRGELRLSTRLLDAPAPDAPHDPALAALLHEIAHAFDRGQGGGWSAQQGFRRLAGWDRIGGVNRYRLRSPDDYERHSPAEAFAVNLEWYLLDPTYACRRPALARWFESTLGQAPLERSPCDSGLPLLGTGSVAGTLALEDLDPARVYAVDYLLADSGGPPMSRFGHSMLRLVVCAPGREPGPRCRMDLAHHRVLSFRAFVDDVQISSWRGLTGGYPSRLFMLPLDQVIDEYNRIELRDLRAWPLALDRKQIGGLLEAAARTHWSYDGDYTFVGNNCAVETGRLLDLALDPQRGRHYRRTTPRGVLRVLARDGLVDPAAHDDAHAAQREGSYFPSARAEYQQLHAMLRGAGQLPALPLERWLDSDAATRGEVPADVTLEHAAAWLVLETAALRRAELRAADVLKRQWTRRDPAMAQVREDARDWSGHLGALSAPGNVIRGDGYGIPQPAELETVPATLAGWNQSASAHWRQLQQAGEDALPARDRLQVAQARERVAWLGARVRELAAGQD
ncbi:DUF4105 domain-containing protein [Stenotrophomonas sp. Marseille-Q4652]|uniref:lipoprotein N-acyltransferase Lnb domain-containing protein n=1 Tax=Stenotrophomonas sp. Marseille-Q4652 TaxID=2866595 RepID=UPI001CE40092|nr:DUF4105 domain-containing protein [Stenotrophomonas sp. Marseille-Q4652]